MRDINWIPNQYKGFRSDDGVFYIGQTPKRFYQLWIGEKMHPESFASADLAKAFAANVKRPPKPVVSEVKLRVTGADAEKVQRILEVHFLGVEVL